MRGRADGRTNAAWWHGAGDVPRLHGYDYTTENVTTTEDATDGDGQISHNDAYPVYHTYRVPRSYGPGPYYYPVRRRSQRRVAPFTRPYLPYDSPNQMLHHQIPPAPVPPHQLPQYQAPLKGRKRSRRSLLLRQKRRSGYNLAAAAAVAAPAGLSPRLPPLIRKKHKMVVYSATVPTDVDDQPKVYWRKIKKTPGQGEVISWCREAVESETSNDGKSVHSTYSRLSVDVKNEMEAMNRDLETILSRFESSFDPNTLHELEERGLGKKKLKQEVITKTVQTSPQRRSPPPLSEEQKKILEMERPPLDRLEEIPVEYLKPRPMRVPSHRETFETSANGGKTTDAVWRAMLQDLLNRGVLNILDEASLTKFQSALNVVNGEAPNMNQKPDGNFRREVVYKSSENLVHRNRGYEELQLTAKTKAPSDSEFVTLSSGARIPKLREGSGLPNPVELEECAKPVESTRFPALVERSGDFLPISSDKVDDHSNWRKTIDEIREHVSQAHCDKCNSCAEQLNEFRRGGSGDKLFTEDKSVNTDRENFKEEMARISSNNFPLGDQNTSSHLSKQITTSNRNESCSLGDTGRGVPGIMSNITVNTALTSRTKATESQTSVSTTNTSEKSIITNPSSSTQLKAGIGVAVEDVGNEEEVPLQRKLESTRLGRTTSAIPYPHRRRPNTPTSRASTVMGKKLEKTSTERGDSEVNQGCGDSSKAQAEKRYQELTSLMDNICSGKIKSSDDLDKNLADLNRSVSDNASLLNTGMCITIIRKLIKIMLMSEPMLESGRKPTDQFGRLLELRKHHMHHIESELNHIEQMENDSLIKARVKAYFLPPSTSNGINQ